MGPALHSAEVVFCGKAVRRDVLPLGPLASGLCRSHLLPAQGAEPWVVVVPHPVRAVTEGSGATYVGAFAPTPPRLGCTRRPLVQERKSRRGALPPTSLPVLAVDKVEPPVRMSTVP